MLFLPRDPSKGLRIAIVRSILISIVVIVLLGAVAFNWFLIISIWGN